MLIREIERRDNEQLAQVIRKILEEFDAAKPGTVYTDPTTDNLYSLFQTENAVYFVVENNDEILGGCGIFPTKGLPEGCTELVKLYLHPKARGKKLGYELLEKCADWARENGSRSLYLESLPELDIAVNLYKSVGYKMLEKPLGESGHFACNLWMLKEL